MKEKIIAIIKKAMKDPGIAVDLSVPEEPKFGHFSTNVALKEAKNREAKPFEFAEEVAAAIGKEPEAKGFIEKIEVVMPGFINMWVKDVAIQEEFTRVQKKKVLDRVANVGKGKKMIVEYSSVNIAKAMNLGHFRTTIIGDALSNIQKARGYEVIRWNYLGDWGTQFGKLIAAYKLWGDKKSVRRAPIEELQALYVRFHKEAEQDSSLEARGQEEFKKLESGDRENRALWKWFKKESLREFKALYQLLGVDFDTWIGESFFEYDLKRVVNQLVDAGIAERSEGALIVRLDDYQLPPALIEKSDGASVYLTRDIANLEYRLAHDTPSEILYVVANEQTLHFAQLFAIAEKLGLHSAKLTHIKYGLVLGESGKKLSTRGGGAVMMKEILEKAIQLARATVEEKARDLREREKEQVSYAVAIGALKYNDLKENRMTDIVFDWEKMLSFSGDSGPYLQYTYARLKSILRKADVSERVLRKASPSALKEERELAIVRKIFELPYVVEKAGELYSTSVLATFLYKLAVAVNQLYESTPILKDEDRARRNARLALIAAVSDTLRAGLGLLGIEVLEKI